MAQFLYHITIKDKQPAKIQPFTTVTRMIHFVSDNLSVFKDKKLMIYRNKRPYLETTYQEVEKWMTLSLNEYELLNTLKVKKKKGGLI